MATKPLPSPEVIRQLLRYEPETGKLFWRSRPVEMFADGEKQSQHQNCAAWNAKHVGKEALIAISDGYRKGIIFGMRIRAHRAIWAIMTDEWPTRGMDIDHIDGNRANNAWLNLRPATRSQNNMNAGVRADNRSGFKGVGFHVASGLWYARVTVSRRVISLGYHKSFEAAVAARIEGEKRHFGKFSSLNRTV